MKYKVILLDADETLFDFKAAERKALCLTMQGFGVTCSSEDMAAYAQVNAALWTQFERGEITKQDIFVRRFQFLFDRFGLTGDVEKANQQYLQYIADCSEVFPGACSFVEKLAQHHTLAIVTNGAAYAQKRRFYASKLSKFIPHLYVSEEIGVGKPDPRYFAAVFHDLKILDLKRVLIVGDSLTSDIRGGIQAGIDTCWYNPTRQQNLSDIIPTLEIATYEELYPYLEKE